LRQAASGPPLTSNVRRQVMVQLARISHVLKTVYNAEDGLPLDASKRLYVRLVRNSSAFIGLQAEIEQAISDPNVSWRSLLCNAEYEVYDAETEDEARHFAQQLLLAPLKETP
jgi:hypothetical protein